MTKKKIGIVVAAVIVIVASVGGFVHSKNADAKEATAKQALIMSIDAMHDQQESAKIAKADAPVVTEEYPARTIPTVTPQAPAPKTTQEAEKAVVANATTAKAEIPQQSPAPLLIAATVIPSAPAKADPAPAITGLSDSDIQRLQSYAQYKTIGGKPAPCFVDFAEMYSSIPDPENMKDCLWIVKAFSPITLSNYSKMKTEWLTSPKLVYRDSNGDFCVRGVLTLTAYDENEFSLAPNEKYQVDAEYRLDNSVLNGKITLSITSTHYLSGFKAVK